MNEEDWEIYQEFLAEALHLLDRLREDLRDWLAGPVDQDRLAAALRAVHTIKGNAAMFELHAIESLAHETEAFLTTFTDADALLTQADILRVQSNADRLDDLLNESGNAPEPQSAESPHVAEQTSDHSDSQTGLSPAPSATREAPAASSASREQDPAAPAVVESLRVPLKHINQTLNHVWEIFLVRNQMAYLFEQNRSLFKEHHKFLQNWDVLDSAMRRNITELENVAMRMRMRTVRVIYDRVEKASRSYLSSHDKSVQILREGDAIEVDKRVIDVLAEPMVHLIRNALDHGIEPPAERRALGKPQVGSIRLNARTSGDQVIISISDDGKGIDPKVLLAKASQQGIDVSHLRSQQEVLELIFLSGFSTAKEVTEVSGRGVGAGAMRAAVLELGGSIRVESTPGKGTSFVIRLPLSLSVVNALLFEVNGATYGTSISDVVEVCRVGPQELHMVSGETYVKLRGQFIPVVDLREQLCGEPRHTNEVSLVVLRDGDALMALRVCAVLQHIELVSKPPPHLAPGLPGVSAYSILPTGRPIFILDLLTLARTGVRNTRRRSLAERSLRHAS